MARAWFRTVLLFAALMLVVGTLALSWLPSSRMSEVPWLPDWLGRWADTHPDRRTAVPLVLVGFLFTACAHWLLESRRPFLVGLVAALVLLELAECGQFLLPDRGPSFGDLAWGGAGAVLGALAARWAIHWAERRAAGR
jgi:hypothetical protein